ncbi:MAG: Spo0E family sporulation regulatory protein-aspartic acid phosphatase [Clostridiaceae bacterium]|nr:Spo0E family sporulation regulatory protein-aspartic acid phosphatase [Clostridiaceae bacterium]
MTVSKEELITKIEEARQRLNNSIDSKKEYEIIYKNSVELDLLIEQYMVAGY